MGQVVIPYSEVWSRDYLVASDKCIHLLFGSWFRSPPKEEKLGGKIKVSGETSFHVGPYGPVRSTETRQG